jgi:hypothetical protein
MVGDWRKFTKEERKIYTYIYGVSSLPRQHYNLKPPDHVLK